MPACSANLPKAEYLFVAALLAGMAAACSTARGQLQVEPWALQLPERQNTVTIPLEGGTHRYVKLRINEKEAGYFLVDTGADISVISGQLAIGMNLRAGDLIDLTTAGDTRKVQTREADRVQIGAVEAKGVKFYALRLDDSGFPKGLQLSGILGMDFIRALPITFDFAANTMSNPPSCIRHRIAPSLGGANQSSVNRSIRVGGESLSSNLGEPTASANPSA